MRIIRGGLAVLGTLFAIFSFLIGTAEAQQSGPVYCNSMGFTAGGAAGSYTLTPNPNPNSATSIKAATGTARLFICGYQVLATGGTSQLVYGTGTNCGTGQIPLTIAYPTTVVGTDTSSNFRGLEVPNGNDVCLVAGAGATTSSAIVYYALQ